MLGRCGSASCSGSIADVAVCQNRLRLLRRRNPGVPIYGLYGGPSSDDAELRRRAAVRSSTTSGSFPDDTGPTMEVAQRRHHVERDGSPIAARASSGTRSSWPSGTWSSCRPWRTLLPPLGVGDMLISGVRPVREVEPWWQWTRGRSSTGVRGFPGSRRLALRPRRGPHVLSIHRPRRTTVLHGALRHDRRARARLSRVQDPRLRPGIPHPARPRHLLSAVVARRARHVPGHAYPEPRPRVGARRCGSR